MARERLHLRLEKEGLSPLFGTLQALHSSLRVGSFHQYYFAKYLFTTAISLVPALIEREVALMKLNTHPYHSCGKAVQAREACLRNLKRLLAGLTPTDLHQYIHFKNHHIQKGRLQEFFDGLEHFRAITIYCIQQIQLWKSYIKGITLDAKKQRQRIQYYLFDQNYYLKILSDNGFIKVSLLKDYIGFAPQNDPFLLHPLLQFQKRQEKSNGITHLLNLFFPPKQHLPQMLAKLQLLSEEYKHNIKSRKSYNMEIVKGFKEPVNLPNISLKKLMAPNRTAPIQPQAKRRTSSIPSFPPQKIVLQDSPLKLSTILSKNQQWKGPQSMDEPTLSYLKGQVIRRVKESMGNNEPLQLLIEGRVAQQLKKYFPFQPQRKQAACLTVTLLLFPQPQLPRRVSNLYSMEMAAYKLMQVEQHELLQQATSATYLHLVRVEKDGQEIGKALFRNGQSSPKSLQCLFLWFLSAGLLPTVLIEIVAFLENQQNAQYIQFNFMCPISNQPISTLIKGLEGAFQHKAQFQTKQLYSSKLQTKIIFYRKQKNIAFIQNLRPCQLYINSYGLLAEKKLLLEGRKVKKSDFWLMMFLRKFIAASDILLLKQSIKWKDRLKLLLSQSKDVEMQFVRELQSQNVTELNGLLTKNKQRLLQVSDIVKGNRINVLKFQLTLSLPYPCKAIYDGLYHRYIIEGQIQGTPSLTLINGGSFTIALFQTDEEPYQHLYNLLLQERKALFIASLWVPMCRLPQNYSERDSVFLESGRSDDLHSIKREMLVGQHLQWFTDLPLQNSIIFQKGVKDKVIKRPFGVGVIKNNIVIYCKIFS